MNTIMKSQQGLWLVTSAAVLWGTIGVATQAIYAQDTTSSLFINLARLGIATPVLLVMCWRVIGVQMWHVPRRDFALMMLSGVMLAISQAAYFTAIRHVGVTIATLLTLCVAPLVVTIISVLLKFEKLTTRLIAALACALIGSVLLVGLNPALNPEHNLPLGVLFSLLSAATYAAMIICGRFLAADYHPLQVTTIGFGAGALMLAAINLLSGAVIVHTTYGWLLLLYLGLVPTALAYGMFQTGLRSVSATTASIVSLLEALVAAILAWWLFGETLQSTGIIGGGLLILSIVLLSRTK